MLTGERVVLRPLRPANAEPLWRLRLEPLTWAQTTEKPLVPQTLEAFRVRFEAPPPEGIAELAVDVAEALVGRAVLFGVDPLARHGEVGLSLLAEHRGHGYGRDVLRVLVDYAFRSRNLRRVHLQTLASNAATVAAYRAAGFVEEGRQRQHAWVEGQYEDVLLMGVLRSEWSGS